MKKLFTLSLILVMAATVSFAQQARSAKVDQSSTLAKEFKMKAQTGNHTNYVSHLNLRAEGDSCANPFMVTTLPATLTGTAIENFNGVYSDTLAWVYTMSGADVVYSFTATADTTLELLLTGDWDQAIAVFTDCTDPQGSQLDAVDDNWAVPYTEEMTLQVVTGTTYYIVLGAYDATATGAWSLEITEYVPCVDNLVTVGTPEVEPNGGLNETPAQYDPRTLGTAAAPTQITGSLSVTGGQRDMDWFNFTTTTTMTIHATADIVCGDIAIFLADNDTNVINYINDNGEFTAEALSSDVIAPGDYWLIITAPTFDDMAVFNYNVELWGEDAVAPSVGESFEGATFPPTGWTIIDNDGDAFKWEHSDPTGVSAQEGDYCATSASWDATAGALTPDNWLITPAFTVDAGEKMSWWVAAQDPAYPADVYEVVISTTTADIASFTTQLHLETLASDQWAMHEYDLSAYAGQTIYAAFHHYNCTDNYVMKIDNVVLPEGTNTVENVATSAVAIYPNPSTGLVNINNVAGADIVIYNILGEQVSAIKAANQFNTVDLSAYGQGTYFVKVVSASQTTTHVLNITK